MSPPSRPPSPPAMAGPGTSGVGDTDPLIGELLADPPVVMVLDDDPVVRRLAEGVLGAAGFIVRTYADAGTCLADFDHFLPDAVCLDLMMSRGSLGMETLVRVQQRSPRLPVIILTSSAETQTVVQAMRLGAYDYLTKPPDPTRWTTTLHNAVVQRRMQLRVAGLERRASDTPYANMVGRSAPMRALFRRLERVAPSEVTVLIHGESGTGKERVASAIHDHSLRAQGPFVVLNCAAIPENLQESELFGHERGAFTGADRRRVGRFEQAHGGTLFLDEIADLSLGLQAKLLRAIQERRFYSVGGGHEIVSNFRLIAASHRHLAEEVRRGRFRADLYYRLAVYEIRVPPLRQRGQDILLLARHFLEQAVKQEGGRAPELSGEVMALLLAYSWPGNVRELENAMAVARLSAEGGVIRRHDLPESIWAPTTPTPPPMMMDIRGTSSARSPSQPPRLGGAEAETDSVRIPLPSSTIPFLRAEAPPQVLEEPLGFEPPGNATMPPQSRNAVPHAPISLTADPFTSMPASGGTTLDAIERQAIHDAFHRHRGNVTAMARDLGIGRATLYRKLARFGLRPAKTLQ